MWKAAFTGRSEKGGDRDRDTTTTSGKSEGRRKKSSKSSRGDVDDTASVMSGTSRRHRSSRHESSSRYGDDDDRVQNSSRYEDDDRDRVQDSSYYSGGPPSVYGSAVSYASPGSGSYATAPTSRATGETRPLTASALRMLPDDDGDEDEWEDDEKTVKSERRRRKRSPSDEREKRRKSSGKEKEKRRSSSRERKDKTRSSTAEKPKDKSSSRRSEPELVTDSSRAIPAMGSFEQFPGQYGGGVMGQQQQPEYTMSGALPNVVPQSQFRGRDHAAPYEQPAPPMGVSRADSYGHAAEYYLDEGQSVTFQPGFRTSTPNMLVNPDHHLMAASSVALPAQDTGHGSAADFYNDTTSFSAPVTPARPTAKPGKQSSSSASKPSRTAKPSQTSSGSAVAAGLAGVAGAAAVNRIGKNGRTSSSHHHSQSEYTTSSSYQQQYGSRPGDYPPTVPSMASLSRPSRHSSDGNVYYATSALGSNGAGASITGSSAYGPNYENTYGTGNVPGKTTNHSNVGIYTAGAAAAGAAAYGIYQNQHKHGRNDSNMAVAGDFGGNGQGPPRSPRPAGFSGGYYPPNSNSGGGMMQQGQYHEHKGPMTKFKDGLLNLISTPEDVAKMEMYTEYIGVCKYCFDPRTSAWDAPRVHHYHKRRDSFESLRRRISKDRLQHKPSYERVDKESRYYASDSSRRRREERHPGIGLAGAGLASVGTGLAANALFNGGKNFDDTYSVQSGHRESSAVRRRSRSSSREKRRRSQYGTIRPGHDEFANVTIRKKDGTIEHRRVARSRSGSGGRKSGLGLGTAVAAGAALGAAGLAAAAGHRSRSSSREHRRRSGRVSSGQSEFSRFERDDRRQSEEGGGGIFGNFFSPPRKQHRESREHQKKRAGFFTFSNGSASSSNSDLAFGGSALSRNGSKASLSRRSSGRSTRGRPRRKSSDQQLAATLAGIGATAAALGAAKVGHRITKRASRPELGARRNVKQHVVGDHRHGSPGSSDEDGWEDELPSDDASSNDGLAFGDYGGKHLTGRQSLESVASQSSAGGLGAWGWRWGGKDNKRKSRRSTSGELPYSVSEYGSTTGPIGAGIAAGAAAGSVFDDSRPVQPNRTVYLDDTGRPLPSVDARSSTSGASSQPLQYIDPKPVSDAGTPRQQSIPGVFDTPTRMHSMPGAFEAEDPPIYRPGPGIVQHPQPMSPARPAFTQPEAEAGYTATVGATDGRPIPRRTQSSPVQSTWGQDAALIGAGVLGAGAIIAGSALSSGRKSRDSQSNVRFGLTEEQERKENRSGKQEDKKTDEERRRADRTRALKEEAERAAKESRQEEVRRAREAENTARAQAKLDLQWEQERKAAEEARILAEKQAHEQRERQWEIERLEKEAADRQAAAAAAAAEFERQRLAREEAERRQAEIERETREREEALRRQQYELAEEAQREDEERRQWDAERYAREYQASARNGSSRDYKEDPRDRRNDETGRKQSSGWTAVAAGAAAAAGVGAVMADREGRKRRQSGKSDSADDSPVSRRPPRTSVDWNADAFAEDREAAEQAELDRQARNQYGQASRGSVERKNGYAATEVKPGSAEHGEPIMDDDIFNPDFFMQSQHSPADRARHEELARKAADKVVAERARAYSPDNRPKENYADFFADEIKDVLAKKPGEKERKIQPDSDVQVYHVEDDSVAPPFALRNDFGGKSKHAPYGVPRLNVIAPTPPPGSRTTSTKGSVPSSPLSKAADAGTERSPDSGKDSKSDRSRSISWGEDEVNVYDVQTPDSFQEKDRESYITSPDLGNIGKGVAAAAGIAGAAVTGAALHDVVVEEGDKTKTYKDEDFTTASSKKSKKDKKKSKKGSKPNADDADSSFLDELSNKPKAPSSYEDVPSERGTEVPYKETEFSRMHKANERDRQTVGAEEIARTPKGQPPGTLPLSVYQQPFLDSVSDFSGIRSVASPGTEGAPPARGYIEGKVKDTTPAEEKRPHIPGEFDDEQNDMTIGASRDVPSEDPIAQGSLSKKEMKKREKEAKRSGSGAFDISEPSTPVKDRDEPVAEPPLSAKEKKKRDKEAKRAGSSFEVEPASTPVEPEETVFEPPLSAKEKKKRDKEAKRASVTFDTDPVTTNTEREAEADTWEPPLSAKERKKREKAAKKAGIDPAYSEEPTPIVESPKADTEEADEYFPGTSSKEQKASQFENGLRRIASTQSAMSMPSWSGDTVISDVTAKPSSPELSKSEQRKAEKQAAFSFADVTDTILAAGGVAAAAAALNDDAEDSGSGSNKKDRMKKRKSKLGESTYDDPRDAPSGMPGGWDTPERKSSPDSADNAKEIPGNAASDRPRENELSKSGPETVPAQETDPGSEWFESTPSGKKNKKKSKRSSVAFDSTPQVSSPLRSEVAWDDYVGMNGDKAESEAARSDPITVIEQRTNDDSKTSRQSSTQDEYFDAGPRVSESPRDMSPEDARSVNSADADKETRRRSRREEARRNSDYYEQPQYAHETQSTVSSEPADGEDRKKHKRRSRHEDDDAVSVSSSRRRSHHVDDDDDTRSVTSSRSRREKEESPTAKKEKKGIFGSLFGRKSSETVPTVKDSREDDEEERRRRKKKHRDSEYGDDDDDTRSVKSESHRRRHRSTDEKDDNDSRERRRRSTHEDDDKYSESASRHHRRRRTDESGESLSRHRSHESKSEHGDRPKHRRRRTDEDKYDSRDQSFLGSRVEDLPPLPVSRPGSPDTAVEWKEGRPLEAGSGTGLVSAAAAGLAVGVAASALSRGKKGKKGGKNRRDQEPEQSREVEKTEYAGPLPSASAHSFPLPYVPEHEEVRAVLEGEDSSPQTPAPVLERPTRPVSIGRPGSSTAVPLRLPGHAPTTPGGKERAKSFSSPLTIASAGSSLTSPATPGSARSRQSRPHSSELKSGIMPLYLVERSRPVQEVEEALPSLPSSKPSSRASSVQGSDEYESAREEFSVANSVASSPDRTRSRSLTLDTIGANNYRAEGDFLGSEQTTPKASEWPQTAIPWSLSSPSAERKAKQQPQFYTWEDFAQDERMHERERGHDFDAATSIEPADSALLIDAPRDRSASPSKAKALAAVAMLGTAAVYASHKSNDRSPERVAEAKRDEPLPSAAAHSFPLPYLPTPEPEEIPQQETSAEAESPRKLEEAFDPVITSKKSKTKGKKGKKQQSAEVETPKQVAPPADATPDRSREPAPQKNDAMLFPSAAAHTISVLPAIDFTEPSPQHEGAHGGVTQADMPQSDAGYFASAAAHSMPPHDPVETSCEVKDQEPSLEPNQLPGLKAEPAPLVIEQRSVQVEPHAETVEVNPPPQLTRKQSKKDKKKAKQTLIFEDEPKALGEELPTTEPISLSGPVQDVDRSTNDTDALSSFNFGLSDFGAVAAGGAIGWGLSQADAFRKSMQQVQNSEPTAEGGARALADDAPAEPSERVVDESAQATEEVFEPISTNKSKKGKKKSKQSFISEASPDVEQESAQNQDLGQSTDPPVVVEEPLEASRDAQPETVQDVQAEPATADTSVVDDWATSTTSKKKSKKDKKKRLSTPFELEAEVPQSETAEQHDPAERGDVADVPQAGSTQTEEKHSDPSSTLVDAAESSSAPPPWNESSQADIKDELATVRRGGLVKKPNESVTTSADAVEAATTEPEPVEDLFPDLSTKKSKKKQKKQKALAEDDLAEAASKEQQQARPEVVQEVVQERDPSIEQHFAADPAPEETIQEVNTSTADATALAEDVVPSSSKKKSKKEKRKSKNVSLHEAEKSAEDIPSLGAHADEAKTIETSDQQEPVFEELAATIDETKQDAIVREADVAAVDDFAPVPSKKNGKKDKRKSKNLPLDETDDTVASQEANVEASKLEESGGAEGTQTADLDASGESSLEIGESQAVDATEPSANVLNVNPDVQTEVTPKHQPEEPSSAQASLAEDEFSQPTSKKKSKKKKQKQLDSSWELEQGEPTIPVEMSTKAAAPDTEKSTEEGSSNTDALAVGAGVAAAAVAASAFASHDDTPSQEEAQPAPEKAAESQAADDIWGAPASKKKSKKDKRKSKTYDWEESQQATSEPAIQNELHDAPLVQDPQTAHDAAETSTGPDAQAVDLPSTQPLEEENPTLFRKQSKKDKKKRKSLAFQVEEESKVKSDPSVETLEANLGTVPAASDPAVEVIHEADREAADEVPQPTETPDDSFHDAEDFFEAQPIADSWHYAEEAALPAEARPSESTPTVDSFKEAAPATDKENETISSETQKAEPAHESWADMMDDSATIVADSYDSSIPKSNLVDDVFGVTTDSAAFSSAPEGKTADQEEIMPDRGVEFEPERASEDMDAFGDPTPKDPAEWSLGTSKKSGKKGKKGKKSVSKAPIMSGSATSSAPESITQLETAAEPEKAEDLPEREEIDKTTSLGAGDATPEPSAELMENASEAKEVSDEPPGPVDKDIASQEQIGTAETPPDVSLTPSDATDAVSNVETAKDLSTAETPPDVSLTPSDATDAVSNVETAKDLSTAETDEFSLPTTSEKKKGKKGKKSQQWEDPVPATETQEVTDDTVQPAENAAVTEQPETIATGPVTEETPDVDNEAIREQQTTTPTADEPEDFTAAPLSKKDRKKAKKAKKSGSQTPQTIDEPSTVEETTILDPDQKQSEAIEALEAQTEDAGERPDDLVTELAAPGDGNGAPSDPAEKLVGKDEIVADHVLPETTYVDQDQSKLDNQTPATELDTPIEESTTSDQQDTAAPAVEDAEFSWASSSKKSKKGKKNKKAVMDIPSSSEDKSLDQRGAAVAAELLAGSTLPETLVEAETPTPTQEEATDDLAWPGASKKKSKKGKKGSKSGFDAAAEPEVALGEQPNNMEPLERTGEATLHIEPEPGQELLATAVEPAEETAHDVAADDASTPVIEATDDFAWASGSKKKGKKSKKGSKSVLETPSTEVKIGKTESQPDTVVLLEPPADAIPVTEDAAVDSATDRLAEPSLEALADASVASPLEPTIEPSTEETAREATVDAPDTTPLEPSTQPTTEESEDLWGTFTSSKKKKGKKGRKSGAFEIDEPKVDESSSLQADEKTEDAPAVNNEPPAQIAEQRGDKQPSIEETLVVPEPSDAEPVEAEDDNWAVPPSSKKKKGKKGKKADAPVIDEPKVDETTSSETIEEAEDALAEPTDKPADEPSPAEETSAIPEPSTVEPTETADDMRATPTTGKKKKGKKGKKSGTATPAAEEAEQPPEPAQASEDKGPVASELLPAEDITERSIPEQVEECGAVAFDMERGDNTNLSGSLTSAGVKDAILEHDTTEQSKDEPMIETPELPTAASVVEETGSWNNLAKEVSQDAQSGQEDDDRFAPQTSKKQTKKGKKNKSSVTETATESLAEPSRDVEISKLPPPEETRSVEDIANAEEQPAPQAESVELENADVVQESQAADTDDFTSSSKSSKKKAKKCKKSKQASLDETPVIVDDGDNVEEADKMDQQEELKPEAEAESGNDTVLLTHEASAADVNTKEPKAEIPHPDSTATDAAVTEPINSDLPAEISTRQEPTESLPAEETTATKALGEDIILPEIAAFTELAPETQVVHIPAQETDDLFAISSGKKKGKKSKKGKQSIFEETSEPKESALEEVLQDEYVPQSTATTSNEVREAESEDVWAPPVKAKAKMLQQLAAENLQNESQAESLESRREIDTSTSDARPSTEADADDLWATPSTGKKNKKGKKGKRDSELAKEEPSDVVMDLPAQENSVQASTKLEVEEKPIDAPIQLQEQPFDDQSAPREVNLESEIERSVEEPTAESLQPDTNKSHDTEREDGIDLTEAAAGAVAAAAAIAVATAPTEGKDSAATTSDVYDWGAVSTKKSKKDKKKARKSGTPAATIDDAAQAEQAAEDGMASRTIEDTMDTTNDQNPVVEDATTSEQRLDNARETSSPLEPTVPSGNELKTTPEPPNADVDFTATVAAGLADSGFNPEMVINDPAFQRRASPTGVAEADPEEDILSTTVSKRKKKGKKGKASLESPPVEAAVSTSDQPKEGSDVDDILNETLASTGFDATLLERAMVASNEQCSAGVDPESEFAFTTTKRKKGKKGKKAAVAEDEEANKAVEQPEPPATVETAVATLAEASHEEPTAAPITTAENNEHSWMVQDEMDVDAMDNAYRAYKKNKRQQKKLKAKSGATSDNPDGSAVDDTERSALMSEAEDTSGKAVTPSTQGGMNAGQDQDQPTVQSPGSATSSNSIVQSVFPGLERIKRRFPPAGTDADSKSQERRASNDPETRGLMHTSEVDSQESALPSQEPSWSFAALQGDDQAFADPSSQDRAVRDSGYETAKRSSHQTDRSSAEVPQIVRTSSSRDSLLQRRSLEPMRVSTPTSPDWDIHTLKQRRGDDSARDTPHHERKASDNTPLEPTNAALSPSRLPEQPSPSQKPSNTHQSSTNHGGAPSSSAPVEYSPALSWDGNHDRSAFSPTSPRTPLDAIPEEHSRRQRSRKRSKARAEVGGPENIKAVRRTETPQAIRAQEEALSPPGRRRRSSRSVSSPTSTSDEVFNRLPWPTVDQENETVHMDRSRPPRHGPPPAMTPDLRSASVLSDRSNASGNHFKSAHEMRSYSRNSNSSSTPSLRRTSLSGDLRAASKRGGGSDLGSLNGSLAGSAVGARASPQTVALEPPPTPPLEHDELIHRGASRAMDTSDDVFQGYGDAQRSQVSPTRPPSVRKRQSMHIHDLETRLDLLVAENRALQEARQASGGARGLDDGSLQDALEARDLQLQAKDAEINQIKAMLQPLQDEVARLTVLSDGLTEANRNLVDDTNGRYATLQAEHAEAHSKWLETSQELESVRSEHGRITSGMRDIVEAEIASSLADKNAEILRLREQLDIAAEQIRALQVQIQSSKSTDFLVQRDEDYFDGACQKLCQHVQQWVLRFSKMSDNRVCRLSTDLNDDKIEARLDNAVLDGSDVDKLLGDRVRRRDVFMSVVMTMVWEYIFTRYLFGMDREQRQKLKALEKLLAEVGPPRAVAHWRATTLTLLSKRPQFEAQCALDTEAVAHEIFEILCMLLPPPSSSRSQLQASLQKVLRIAVDLAIEMRTQRAEFIMLPPLQPEYDTNGELVRKVYFNSSLMNERSGLFSSNEELAAKHAVVKIVLFPLVVKKGDDVGEGDDEIVVCPAQVLVLNDGGRDKKIVRVMSGAMEIDEPIRSRQSNRSLMSDVQGGSGF
ncbi:hypothetical protein BST61_g10620 [Cercospora zeina]